MLPVPWVEPADVTAAVLWPASAEARYATGATLPVDTGTLVRERACGERRARHRRGARAGPLARRVRASRFATGVAPAVDAGLSVR